MDVDVDFKRNVVKQQTCGFNIVEIDAIADKTLC